MKKSLWYFAPALLLAVVAISVRAADLESTPQGKAFRAQEKAVKAGDYEAYKKTMTKASAAAMEKQTKEMGKGPKAVMEMMQMMQATDTKLTSLKVDKSKATLMATGMAMGEMNKGTIDLEQEDGQWKIAKQSWSNAK